MRVDYDYLHELLRVFIDDEKPVLTCEDFTEHTEKDLQKFCLHVKLLSDQGLVVNAFKDSTDLGVQFDWDDEGYYLVEAPWRLTSQGYDFAATLDKPEMLTLVREKMANEGISAVVDISKSFARKKLEKVLEEHFT
ncbi:hypothetical protein Q7142_004614 [Vibrio parahaemolyticus]|uniref:hypothetical protein n=1 Tax=Vibrio parahaemolyticus TaxID=670 RepID=UPI001E089810|nr:hypothetical protein [Vibrio parahaemolyticus]EGR2232641.1 DUF2513 domain-containing protein [Vibrio parahaemolyticus]ELA7626303.1 hypothetical protein [Vibrio parahaemolyticus]ELY2116758.1 hypothetical protein [Vibrio parahaemolyticus]WMN69492.1 hypothetical protein NI387_06970 [Vibrio parahaemolyticus]